MKTPEETTIRISSRGAGKIFYFECLTAKQRETIKELRQRLAQVERERDVLANALEGIKFCGDCLHLYSKDQGMCLSCSQDRERSKPLWQWRGVVEENSR